MVVVIGPMLAGLGICAEVTPEAAEGSGAPLTRRSAAASLRSPAAQLRFGASGTGEADRIVARAASASTRRHRAMADDERPIRVF
jgi:hypothetical protein